MAPLLLVQRPFLSHLGYVPFPDESGRNTDGGEEQGSGPRLLGGGGWDCSPSPCPWLTQDSDYVVAVRNFLPEDPALLAFHKGDIIHLQPLEPPRMGQGRGTERVREGEAGQGGLPPGADTDFTPRLQCRMRGPQEGRVLGGAAAQRP